MRTEFVCPDGQKIAIPECYRRCRLGDRCAPVSYLREVGGDGQQTGWLPGKKPSCTQLLKGTRQAWLETAVPYAVVPDDAAFMVVGSAGHSRLEDAGRAGGQNVEGWVELDGIIGRFDLVEPNEDGPQCFTLIDYKVVGSYAIVKALGMETERRPRVDSTGAPVLYRGKPQYYSVTTVDPARSDLGDYLWQENFYRVAWNQQTAARFNAAPALFNEGAAPAKITRMRLLMIARDGGTYMAKNRGITRNLYYFEVSLVADQEVRARFAQKRDAFLGAVRANPGALAAHEWPSPCNPDEAWEGRKCKQYCPVARACIQHGDNPWVRPDQLADEAEGAIETRVQAEGDNGIPTGEVG